MSCLIIQCRLYILKGLQVIKLAKSPHAEEMIDSIAFEFEKEMATQVLMNALKN